MIGGDFVARPRSQMEPIWGDWISCGFVHRAGVVIQTAGNGEVQAVGVFGDTRDVDPESALHAIRLNALAQHVVCLWP